jgi:hypothetical protein
MLLTLATVLAVTTAPLPQSPGPSLAPVVINEISYDDDSTDNLEFVELWNRTAAPIDISGWVLRGREGVGTSINQTFTFAGAAGSGTTMIAPGQYLLVSNVAVPNHNPAFVIPGDFLENGGTTTAPGSDGLTLDDDLGNVIDAVVWEYAAWTNPVPVWLEGQGLQGGNQLNAPALGRGSQSWQRWLDGYDSNDNGLDFCTMEWTPGAANGSANPLPLPIVQDCDGLVGSTIQGVFSSSFVLPTIYNPLSITTSGVGTWALPAPSPQGGNVAALHDTTGGGNSHTTLQAVGSDFLVETWVYIAGGCAPGVAANEGESWAIGIGHGDSFGHPIDVPGTYYPGLLCGIGNGPGLTGVCWIAYNRVGQTDLYLVDMNNGGSGFTILGGPITATPGVNDGWQRLRIRGSGPAIVGNFGGNYGVDDGTRFTGFAVPRKFGQVYLQYRECILTNANMRPLVIDDLQIYGAVDPSVVVIGTGSPTSVGIPSISANGPPQVGNATFAITASGLIPGGLSVIALDLGLLLPGIPVPDTQPSLLLYATPTVVFLVTNDPTGFGSFPLALPPTNSLATALLAAQYFDYDPVFLSAYNLPVGSTPGAQITVGN